MPLTVRIATRKSPLALWQAEHVASALRAAHRGIAVEVVGMSTQGDKILDTPLAKIGGKGLFVKELEVALMEGRADLAVHSMKDVPMELPEGYLLTAIGAREDARDAFVSNAYARLSELPPGAVVGTSSLRREAQLRAAWQTVADFIDAEAVKDVQPAPVPPARSGRRAQRGGTATAVATRRRPSRRAQAPSSEGSSFQSISERV